MRTPPKKRAGVPTGRRIRNGLEMDVSTAAAFRGLSEKALRGEVARGTVPYRRRGGRIVFLRDELERFMRALPGVSVDEAIANLAKRGGA